MAWWQDRRWWRDRSLTLTLLGLFVVCTIGQVLTGRAEYNNELVEHGAPALGLREYFGVGHPWEALFENWESEFLQMAVFVTFSVFLYQRGSPESRRPGVVELVDADPRRFRDRPDVPWPVRRGGWVLRVYEHSLGLALTMLFLFSWAGHALGGWAASSADALRHGETALAFAGYLTSSQFWFESLQNWQSEFLSVAAMVWLGVYLRERGSPESKPVHAPHDETGR